MRKRGERERKMLRVRGDNTITKDAARLTPMFKPELPA